MQDRFRGCLMGLAVGDAVGTTLEFVPRGNIGIGEGMIAPVTDMVGNGPFCLKAGQWTDDTSMALCLAQSLIDVGFDGEDQQKNYCKWRDEGYYSSTGVLFDIGYTTAQALRKFTDTGVWQSGSTDENTSGNGSIMRLAPVPMFYQNSIYKSVKYSIQSSMTTHGSRSCLDSCGLMGLILSGLLREFPKEFVLDMYEDFRLYVRESLGSNHIIKKEVKDIALGEYMNKSIDEIKGSGYVVESLEASLWCFHKTDNFKEAILKAVNLGDDADTTGAIVGQFAGAHYGLSGIPKSWVEKVTMKDKIIELADRLFELSEENK